MTEEQAVGRLEQAIKRDFERMTQDGSRYNCRWAAFAAWQEMTEIALEKHDRT